MFIQTQTTPNPNSLKFLPEKVVSNSGSYEIKKKDSTNNNLIRNILAISGIKSVFLGVDFISVNKEQNINWEEIKHIVISLINEHYQSGKKFVIDKDPHERESKENLIEIERQIIKILDTKIKPAVAKDGGNIKFKGFKDGIVKVELQGSCSGCPSSIMTLKQGIQNLLCHYIADVKEVVAVQE